MTNFFDFECISYGTEVTYGAWNLQKRSMHKDFKYILPRSERLVLASKLRYKI